MSEFKITPPREELVRLARKLIVPYAVERFEFEELTCEKVLDGTISQIESQIDWNIDNGYSTHKFTKLLHAKLLLLKYDKNGK